MKLQPNTNNPRRTSTAEDARVISASGPARVLRNTYALLALSMIPTVAGAWLGLATGLSGVPWAAWRGMVVFMVGAFGLIFAIEQEAATRRPRCRCCWASRSSWD